MTSIESYKVSAGQEAQLVGLEQWLVERALVDFDFAELFETLCERIAAMGVSLWRAHIAMGSLHPMVSSTDVTWWRDRAIAQNARGWTDEAQLQWQQSPLRAVLDERLPFLRERLDSDGPWQRFPVLVQFAREGATDYFVLPFAFTERTRAIDANDGAIASWVSDRQGGFLDEEIALLRRVASRLAVIAKLAKREQTLVGLLSAYLGSEAGRRVLDGQVRRGDISTIPAVIWYSDLRDSTNLAERLSSQEFLNTLNHYFESTASAVLDHGGEVLRFIGDAVLAIFPVSGVEGAERWARVALAAAQSANARLAITNNKRAANGQPELSFGLGLHIGDVQFGNIGIAERLEFSVVGPVANKVCRIEGLTKELGETVIVSGEFAALLPLEWRALGVHQMRGIGVPEVLYAPPLHGNAPAE